jgi:hypothetical protein
MQHYYIPAFLMIICVGIQAADIPQSAVAEVKYYLTMEDVRKDMFHTVTVSIGPDTTMYDVQDVLQRKVGQGFIRFRAIGSPPWATVKLLSTPDQRSQEPLLISRFGSAQGAKQELETIHYSFWAFKYEYFPRV